MKVKYLGLKISIIATTIMATPLVWAALAYPEWQPASTGTTDATIAGPFPAPEQTRTRRVVIVPRLVDANGQLWTGAGLQSVPVTAQPGAPAQQSTVQQPAPAAPPPQPAQRQTAPARSSASTRGS